MKNIMPPINTPDNAFHDGNPATGEQGTIVPGLWLNNVQGATRNTQQELISVLNEAGIEIDESINNQLSLAILKLITDKTPALPVASLIIKGIVQLSSSTASTSEALAATPKAVKTVNDAVTKVVNDLSTNGIGLLSMTGIQAFDFQTFVFTSGANYIADSTNWINVPTEISYPAGLAISIKVDYVVGTQIGLEIKPSTVSSTNFRAWYLRLGGYPGSRTFTAREIQTSANPVPISGGGTGATTAAGAIVNLGLGDGSLVPIGVPLPYPLATPPAGFLKCNGSSFSTTTYPRLALMYPSGVLPDLRGEFVRGWDDGRGVNLGRALLTLELDAFQGHFHEQWGVANQGQNTGLADTVKNPSNLLSSDSVRKPTTDGTNGTPRTASETRPRSIAFNYIVRAI
ncbi:TPA: phage tail protein [Yersinia enterocolitica]